jgi:hypothetical protein
VTITELIANLERAREKHGDLPVFGAWEGQVSKDITVMIWEGNQHHGRRILIDTDCRDVGEMIP